MGVARYDVKQLAPSVDCNGLAVQLCQAMAVASKVIPSAEAAVRTAAGEDCCTMQCLRSMHL